MAKVIQIKNCGQFHGYLELEAGYILITDKYRTKNGEPESNKIHLVEFSCTGLSIDYFKTKVEINEEKTGKYFYSDKIKPLVQCSEEETPDRQVKMCKTCYDKVKIV